MSKGVCILVFSAMMGCAHWRLPHVVLKIDIEAQIHPQERRSENVKVSETPSN